VPWELRDVVSFAIILSLYLCFMKFFSKVIDSISPTHGPQLYIICFVDITSLLICFLLLKKIILNNYRQGWDLLIEKKYSIKSHLTISIIIGLLLGSFSLFSYYLLTPHHLRQPLPTNHFFIALIYGIIIAPITEEVWFRSFFYRGLKKKWGIVIAFIISILFFLLYHIFNFSLIHLLIFSITITLFYEKTNALYNCILIHSISNCVFFLSRQFL
jgi:membrane protease YdiL (CAAX protease family)